MSNGFGSILIGCLIGIPLVLILVRVRRQVDSNRNSRDHLTSGTPPVHPTPSASKGHDAHDKGGHGDHGHGKPDSFLYGLGKDLLLYLVIAAGMMYLAGIGPFKRENEQETPRAPITASASPRSPVEVDEEPTQPPPPSTDEQQVHKTNAPVGDEWVVILNKPDQVLNVCRQDDPGCTEKVVSGVRFMCERKWSGVREEFGSGICDRNATRFFVQSTSSTPVPIFWFFTPK